MYCEWSADEIHIDKLEIFAHHGVYPEERREGQTFYVNAVLYLDIGEAGRSDDLEQTVDYGAVCHFVTDWMGNNTCSLLEAVACRLAEAILLKYKMLSGIDLEIVKPYAPVRLPFRGLSVRVRRNWHRAYVGVGSNVGDRHAHIKAAVEALRANPLVELRQISDMIITKTYGGVQQEDFVNGVLELDTLLEPRQLLRLLQEIEKEEGRTRTIHWGPRTLDLDILFFDRLVTADKELTIPHPDMENRRFVLEPLCNLAPYLRHPATGKTVSALLRELEPGESR